MVSPNSTLPDDRKEAQDSAYNPGEQAHREGMGVDNHETIPGYNREGDDIGHLDPDNDSTAAVKEDEDKGGNWNDKTSSYGGNKSKGGKQLSAMNVRAVLKKRGPLGLIALLGLGGGLAGTALFSPGLILVQMKEALVDRFDTQLASMDARTTKLFGSKTDGLTSGVCGKTITIKCRFSTMDDDQIKRLNDAGVDVEGEKVGDGTRTQPSSFTLNDKTYSASEFASSTDPAVKAAKLKAINPKYAGFSDDIWSKVATKLGITKERALPDGDDATKEKAVDDQVQNGEKVDLSDDGVTCDSKGNCTKSDGTPLTEDEKAARTAAIKASEDVVETGAEDAAESAIGGAAKGALNTVGDFIKVTGPADIACQAFSAVRGVGYAAKTVRAIQLARYAMIFVNTADQIEAGTAKPEDVAYLGGILTSIGTDVASGAKRKAAMDSAGMRYSLFGDTSGFTEKSADGSYISQFMAGGGLTGDLIAITDYINSSFSVLGYANPVEDCKTLNSSWVQLGSAVAGIALMFVPGVDVVIGASDVAKGVASAGVSVMLSVLPSLLQGIIAGNVTKGIVGEDSGNAITSGFGVISSDVAQAGGNAPMSVSDAVQYASLNNTVLASYTSDEAKTLSPFDASNKDTFLGSIVNKLLPFVSTTGSINNPFVAFGSLATSSFASLIPSAAAISNENYQQAYTTCNDPDYTSMGIATDPFCNPVFGIPTQYLNRDPIAVATALDGQYDPVSGDPVAGSQYATYVNNCMNRAEPLGSSGSDGSGDTGDPATGGTDCKINDSNANYYLFYMDQRVDADMSDPNGSNDSQSSSSGSSSSATTPTTTTTTPAASGSTQGVIINNLTAFNDPSTHLSVMALPTSSSVTKTVGLPINLGWYWGVA